MLTLQWRSKTEKPPPPQHQKQGRRTTQTHNADAQCSRRCSCKCTKVGYQTLYFFGYRPNYVSTTKDQFTLNQTVVVWTDLTPLQKKKILKETLTCECVFLKTGFFLHSTHAPFRKISVHMKTQKYNWNAVKSMPKKSCYRKATHH